MGPIDSESAVRPHARRYRQIRLCRTGAALSTLIRNQDVARKALRRVPLLARLAAAPGKVPLAGECKNSAGNCSSLVTRISRSYGSPPHSDRGKKSVGRRRSLAEYDPSRQSLFAVHCSAGRDVIIPPRKTNGNYLHGCAARPHLLASGRTRSKMPQLSSLRSRQLLAVSC
jgi:hypothetical protein